MRVNFISLIFTFWVYLFLGFCGSVLAQGEEFEIGKSVIHPAHPLYFLKSVREILELKFAPTSEIKSIRYLEFAQRRIREVKSLVAVQRPDLIAPTLEHYLAHLQKVLGLTNLKDEAKAREVLDTVYIHLQNLEDVYSKVAHEPAKRSIRATVFRVWEWHNLLKERLNPKLQARLNGSLSTTQNKICHFLAKEASSSALNEVEQEVLLERVQKCSQSLK